LYLFNISFYSTLCNIEQSNLSFASINIGFPVCSRLPEMLLFFRLISYFLASVYAGKRDWYHCPPYYLRLAKNLIIFNLSCTQLCFSGRTSTKYWRNARSGNFITRSAKYFFSVEIPSSQIFFSPGRNSTFHYCKRSN
jgi:hypothetical protein